MMSLKKTILTAIAVFFLAVLVHAEIIFLKDGRLLHVKILSGDEQGIAVERLDNGGKLFIRWELLREEDRTRLRVEYGLEDDASGADLLMPGHRIHVRKGDYYDGLIVEEDQNQVVLLRENGRTTYKREAIRRIEERDVSVFDVYDSEELYQQKLAEIQPVEGDVVSHFEMARYATQVFMYHEAIGHYVAVRDADPEYKADYIENQLKRLEVLDRNKELRDAIKVAERAGRQHRYAECLGYFDEILAVSDLDETLKEEVQKKKERFEKKRLKYYSQLVVRDYHREVRKRIKKLASSRDIRSKDPEKTLTIQKAMSYVRQQLHKDIVQAIADKYELDPKKEVEVMWKDRKTRVKYTATYGSGTFIVERAGGGAGGGRQAANNQQVQNLLERLRNQRRGGNQQQPQQAQQPKLVTRDEWWQQSDSVQRDFFLRAYYAEHGGQMQIVSTAWRPCPTCGGTGTIKQLGAQGAMVKVTCPRSHGLKGDKLVYYR